MLQHQDDSIAAEQPEMAGNFANHTPCVVAVLIPTLECINIMLCNATFGCGATKLRGCPPEGIISRHWGKYKYQGRERHEEIGETEIGSSEHVGSGKQFVRSHVARDLYFYLNYTLLLVYFIYYYYPSIK